MADSLILKLLRPDRLRGSGTAATNMCLVASGASEAFFEMGIHCWDIAAGVVIVREAGGIILDVDGVYTLPDVTAEHQRDKYSVTLQTTNK